jgi:hypothetical protein
MSAPFSCLRFLFKGLLWVFGGRRLCHLTRHTSAPQGPAQWAGERRKGGKCKMKRKRVRRSCSKRGEETRHVLNLAVRKLPPVTYGNVGSPCTCIDVRLQTMRERETRRRPSKSRFLLGHREMRSFPLSPRWSKQFTTYYKTNLRGNRCRVEGGGEAGAAGHFSQLPSPSPSPRVPLLVIITVTEKQRSKDHVTQVTHCHVF